MTLHATQDCMNMVRGDSYLIYFQKPQLVNTARKSKPIPKGRALPCFISVLGQGSLIKVRGEKRVHLSSQLQAVCRSTVVERLGQELEMAR